LVDTDHWMADIDHWVLEEEAILGNFHDGSIISGSFSILNKWG